MPRRVGDAPGSSRRPPRREPRAAFLVPAPSAAPGDGGAARRGACETLRDGAPSMPARHRARVAGQGARAAGGGGGGRARAERRLGRAAAPRVRGCRARERARLRVRYDFLEPLLEFRALARAAGEGGARGAVPHIASARFVEESVIWSTYKELPGGCVILDDRPGGAL